MAEIRRASPLTPTLLIALALLWGGTAAALAQDATTTTPPELRDFRLDSPRAEPEPDTETLPPAVSAPLPAPTPSSPDTAPSLARPAVSPSPRTQAPPSPRTPTQAESQAAPESVSRSPAEIRTTATPPPPATAATAEQPADDDLIRIGGMIMLVLLAAAGGLYGYRRRTKAAAASAQPIARGTPQLPRKPRNASYKPATKPLAPHSYAEPPWQSPLTMIFVPDTAVISLANLVLRGQLQIMNEGTEALQGLRLSTALIAASAQQQVAIDSFFADPTEAGPSSVGAIGPGKRISLKLELSRPLQNMQTFLLGDRTCLVPIFLAHISYDSVAPNQEAQLVTLIGREANPPTTKMAPLRLDLGPRSFGQLGQRPLPA